MKRYSRKRWKSVDSTHIFIQFASELQCCTGDISVVPQDVSVKATHRAIFQAKQRCTLTADFNVLNPIDEAFSNYMQNMALNFINTVGIVELLRLMNHGFIFESMKFTSKVIARSIAAWQPFCVY